jgi:crotonobetainyl-CoA:carnitine CoA-transferase CaiB-like acyl-CoA transferase
MTWPDPELAAPMTGALRGVRVLELARIIAGPLAGMYLADLGADVVKIERPGGDEMRGYGPEKWDGAGSTFLALNRNKRSVVMDLREESERERLLELVADADVLIESYRPGVMARWDLGFERLRAANPRIIVCSITGFGGTGPSAGLGANNLIAEAFGGSISVSKDPGDRMLAGPPMTDFFTGTNAALAIMSRLIVPREERRAAHVETSLLESQTLLMSGYIVGYLATGTNPDRNIGLPFTVPNQMFSASDGRLVLASNSEDMWRRLCVAIGRDDWLERPEYATNALRMQRQAEIVSALDEELAQRPRDYWLDAFDKARVSAAPVNSVEDLLHNPQVQALGITVPLPGGSTPNLTTVRLPFTVDGRPPHGDHPIPPPALDNAGDQFRGSADAARYARRRFQ